MILWLGDRSCATTAATFSALFTCIGPLRGGWWLVAGLDHPLSATLHNQARGVQDHWSSELPASHLTFCDMDMALARGSRKTVARLRFNKQGL